MLPGKSNFSDGPLVMRLFLCAALTLLLPIAAAVAQETSTPQAPEKVQANQTLSYGQGTPSVTCAPGHYCALALQQGETVEKFDEPDRKWSVTQATYGASQFATPMLILSPLAADATSQLTVTTDRRSYVVTLLATKTKWTSLTAFSYPNP